MYRTVKTIIINNRLQSESKKQSAKQFTALARHERNVSQSRTECHQGAEPEREHSLVFRTVTLHPIRFSRLRGQNFVPGSLSG